MATPRCEELHEHCLASNRFIPCRFGDLNCTDWASGQHHHEDTPKCHRS